jgi:hypothetical protein
MVQADENRESWHFDRLLTSTTRQTNINKISRYAYKGRPKGAT